jgi:hypothetical protein
MKFDKILKDFRKKPWWFKGLIVGLIFGFLSYPFFYLPMLIFPPTMIIAYMILFIVNEFIPEYCFLCMFLALAILHSIVFAAIGLVFDLYKKFKSNR